MKRKVFSFVDGSKGDVYRCVLLAMKADPPRLSFPYDDMVKRSARERFDAANSLYPNVADGVDGMNFITQCVNSSKQGGAWLSLRHPLCRS